MLANAQRVCDETMSDARKQADLIVADAKAKADRLVAEAKAESKRLQDGLDTLRSAASDYRARFPPPGRRPAACAQCRKRAV